ncbi:MAG: glycosyltransferase [Candidatus Symbiothrix sp.]|jgi:glycosyltransferase involved in cell wall biosynthesis|nr:glycosyltransferase [Candidatus Symbiothrix sp.]
MTVSIVIPVYNVSKFIGKCLYSALSQTYPDIEYILIDDATPDNSMEIVTEILSNHPRKEAVKMVHHRENKGLAGARNTGIQYSTGDYLFFLDSDDELPPDCIETLVSCMDNQEVDFVIGEIKVIGNERKAYPPLLLQEGIYQGNDFILDSFLERKWYEMAWNKLIKRSIFTEKNIRFEEGIVHEDTLWSFQLALTAQSMAVTSVPTYLYHIQSNSITQKKSKKNIESFYFVLDKTIKSATQNRLFATHKYIYSYLENLRIFFIKSLVNNAFEKKYIQEQQNKINALYQQFVWKSKSRHFKFRLKDFVLLLWMKLKN